MPYIPQDRRDNLLNGEIRPVNPGDLNFLITMIIQDYLAPSARYTDFNDVIGVLECAKLELYRRLVAPYEDTKIEENGDVY